MTFGILGAASRTQLSVGISPGAAASGQPWAVTLGQMCSQACHLARPHGTPLLRRRLLDCRLTLTGSECRCQVPIFPNREAGKRKGCCGLHIFKRWKQKASSLSMLAGCLPCLPSPARQTLPPARALAGRAALPGRPVAGPPGGTHWPHLLPRHESSGCNKLTTLRRPFCHLSHSHSHCWAFVGESFVAFENVISGK